MPACISPIWIRNVGNVPCGKCNFCLESRRRDWAFRLKQENRHAASSHFLTLTYADECVPVHDSGKLTLRKQDLQKFMKRLRKKQEKYSPLTVRYYAVGEYGSQTHRPHYHALLFNVHQEVMSRVHEVWDKGFTCVGDVSPASVNYVSGYVINRAGVYEGQDAPFALITSRSGGIGKRYLDTHASWHRQGKRNYVQEGEYRGRLPRYYRDKIFSSLERDLFRMEHEVLRDEKLAKAVEDASLYHHDPYAYMIEREHFAHEDLGRRFMKSSKLKTL